MKLKENQMELYLSSGYFNAEKDYTCLEFVRFPTEAELNSTYSKNSQGFRKFSNFYNKKNLIGVIPDEFFMDRLFFDKNLIGCAMYGDYIYVPGFGNKATMQITKISIVNLETGEVVKELSLI